MVIVDFLKRRLNDGKPANLYFWRDSAGHEIDLICDHAGKLLPIEIKAGQTITSDYFKALTFWAGMAGTQEGYVIYGGDQVQQRSNGTAVLPYHKMQGINP